jgi:hypothetical protein
VNKMKDDFEKILDVCIDRMNRGESLDSCLADYPDYVAQLEPLLQAMLVSKQTYPFTPSPDVKRANRARFNSALENLERKRAERKQWFARLHGWSRVWVSTAAVLIIAVISYFGIKSAMTPEETILQPGPDNITPDILPTQTMVVMLPQPDPEGNFAFLISDDVNAIGDFESVNISISKVSLQKSNDAGQWIEFEPEMTEVDLTLVQGDKTQEIWRGNIPDGIYNQVSIEVSDVIGILKETDETIEVKLPGQKLHISKNFSVSSVDLTTFTYDLTVVAAGSDQNGVGYILKPQADQSGASHKPDDTKGGSGKEGK